MIMQDMKTPSTRAEFERNFHLLHHRMVQGKFFVANGIQLGLEKVRYLPNGRIDLLSIDERARLNANMSAQFEEDGAFAEILKNEA